MDRKPKRFGRAIGLRPDKVAEYKKIHDEIWPEIAAVTTQCHLHNYSIFLHRRPDGECTLFAYFEYTGDDFEADMKVLDANPKSSGWATLCEACQLPFENRSEDEWWSSLEEMFYQA